MAHIKHKLACACTQQSMYIGMYASQTCITYDHADLCQCSHACCNELQTCLTTYDLPGTPAWESKSGNSS